MHPWHIKIQKRRKIIHGMHPVGHKERWIDLNFFHVKTVKTYNIIFLTAQDMVFFQALVFQNMDNAIEWVNLYPLDSASISWILLWWITLSRVWKTGARQLYIMVFTYWKDGGLESPIPTVLGIGGWRSDPADITDCWSSLLPWSDTLLVSDVTSWNNELITG